MTVTSTKRLAWILVVAALGCGSKEPAKEASKDPAPAKEALKEPGKNPAPAKEPAAGDGVTCETALKTSYAIVDAQGTPALKKAMVENPFDKSVAECKTQNWSADLRGCLAAAKTVDDVYHDCFVRPLKGHPLTVKRTIKVSDAAGLKAADPPMLTLDGDFFQVRDDCGVLFADTGTGGAGFFLLCGGKTRGPMTTPDEVTEMFAKLSADMAAQHSTVMNLIDNMPSGRFGGWKVCDQAGNCHIE